MTTLPVRLGDEPRNELVSPVTKGLEYPTNVGKPDPLHRREEKVMADQSDDVQGIPLSHVMADGRGGASVRFY